MVESLKTLLTSLRMPTGGRVQGLTPKDITQALRCPSARPAAVEVVFARLTAATSTRLAAVRHKVDSRETLGILL
jgi:hypothetical protein